MFNSAVLFLCSLTLINGELVLNVKSRNEIVKESIFANTSEDAVLLEFVVSEGSYFSQMIDFKQELQIFKVIRLGEEELGQIPFQVHCFLLQFSRGEFISSDAMAKLRQKNPGTVRIPEEEKPFEAYKMDLTVNIHGSSMLSPHISKFCSDAANTYASDQDLKLWASQIQDLDGDWSFISEATQRIPLKDLVKCSTSLREFPTACLCQQQVCVPWYPCALKYCKGHDNTGKAISYRCGIRTCRKCRTFEFYVPSRERCLSDFSDQQMQKRKEARRKREKVQGHPEAASPYPEVSDRPDLY